MKKKTTARVAGLIAIMKIVVLIKKWQGQLEIMISVSLARFFKQSFEKCPIETAPVFQALVAVRSYRSGALFAGRAICRIEKFNCLQ